MIKNLKSKLLISILTIATMLSLSTMCFAAEDAKVYTLEDIKLFDTVMFKGDTYARTIFGKESIRKTFAEPEYGIVTVIRKDKEHSLHINEKGWIAPSQITEKVGTYITIDFEKINGGLRSALKVNGEFMKIDSENEAVLSLKDGVLKIGADGETKINLQTNKGELVTIEAVVNNGILQLDIPNAEIKASLGESGITLTKAGEELAEITVSGEASAKIALDSNGLQVSGEATATGDITIKDKEIISGTVAGNGTITADLSGIKADATMSEQISVLQKIKAKMEQKIQADINLESAGVAVSGNVAVNDKQIVSGNASTEYTYISDNLNVEAGLNGKTILNKDVKVIQSIKALLTKMAVATAAL